MEFTLQEKIPFVHYHKIEKKKKKRDERRRRIKDLQIKGEK